MIVAFGLGEGLDINCEGVADGVGEGVRKGVADGDGVGTVLGIRKCFPGSGIPDPPAQLK